MSISEDWTSIRKLAADCFNIAGGRPKGVCMSIKWGDQVGTPSGAIVVQGTNPTPDQMVAITAKAKLIRSIIQQYPSVPNDSVKVQWADQTDPNVDCPPPPPNSQSPVYDPALIPTKGPQNNFTLNMI